MDYLLACKQDNKICIPYIVGLDEGKPEFFIIYLFIYLSMDQISIFFYLQHAPLQIVILHAWNDHHKHSVYLFWLF